MDKSNVCNLLRVLCCYDTKRQWAEECELTKDTLSDTNLNSYKSKETLQAIADSFGLEYAQLAFAFVHLERYDYDNKEERRKAILFLLSLLKKD